MGWFIAGYPFSLEIIDWVLRAVMVAYIVFRRRPVAVSLAWLGIILFFPLIGLFIYFMVGEPRLGSRRGRKYERLTKGMEADALRLFTQRGYVADHVDERVAAIAQFGKASTGMPALRGNTLTMLRDNDAVLAALVKEVDAARHHVHMLYYIWLDDPAGRRVGEALIRAANRGIRVRVLIDSAGGRPFFGGPLHQAMTAAGIQVVEALPVSLWRIPFARIDLRNHRKIAVFDGKVAYVGSQNINEPRYKSRRWKRIGKWIDATVRVEGPAAQALAVTFLRDWQLDAEEDIEDIAPFLPELTLLEDADSVAQVLASGPGPTPQAIHQALLTTIYLAREEVLITTPYFVPDEALTEALTAAAVRGVRVVLVLPSVSDAPLVACAARSHYADLLDVGAEIWEYQGGLFHSKTVTMDRRIGLIGSTNMDQRSFYLNFEVTLFSYDDDFASILRFVQMDYISRSERIYPDEWRKRPLLERLRDNAAQLLGPLL